MSYEEVGRAPQAADEHPMLKRIDTTRKRVEDKKRAREEAALLDRTFQEIGEAGAIQRKVNLLLDAIDEGVLTDHQAETVLNRVRSYFDFSDGAAPSPDEVTQRAAMFLAFFEEVMDDQGFRDFVWRQDQKAGREREERMSARAANASEAMREVGDDLTGEDIDERMDEYKQWFVWKFEQWSTTHAPADDPEDIIQAGYDALGALALVPEKSVRFELFGWLRDRTFNVRNWRVLREQLRGIIRAAAHERG